MNDDRNKLRILNINIKDVTNDYLVVEVFKYENYEFGKSLGIIIMENGFFNTPFKQDVYKNMLEYNKFALVPVSFRIKNLK